jgi:hypothetical protein
MKKITLLFLTLCSLTLFGQVKLTSSLTQFLQGTTYTNSNKMEYSYDSNNNLLEETEFSWVSSQWKKSYGSIYTYNADNMAIVELSQNYDMNTNTISDDYRTNYMYNVDGNLIQILDEEYLGSSWVNVYKVDLQYSNNRISSGLSLEWNGSNWVYGEDSSKITINYNSNGTASSIVSDRWDGASWVASDRTIYTHDGSNRTTIEDGQAWNGASWVTDYRLEYTYDTYGNAIEQKDFYLNNGTLILGSDETFTFDTTQLMASFVHPFKDKTGIDYLFSGEKIVNKIINSISSSNNYKTTYNYGEATASVNDFSLVDVKVYPNPATNFIKVTAGNVAIKNIELYTILGKKIMTSTKNDLNIENLVNGVYVLKIQSKEGGFATKRIIKN